MICSMLPLGASLSVEADSRMSCRRSFADSPACQRLLQRAMDAGMGLLARQVPLANSYRSSEGAALRSRSVTSMPCRDEVWDRAKGAHEISRTSMAQKESRRGRSEEHTAEL